MTRPEEIREWINKYLTRQFICDPSRLPDDECRGEAVKILKYLDSKGVVLKVERELPQYPISLRMSAYAEDIQQDMLKAGYVAVEPLVEEG